MKLHGAAMNQPPPRVLALARFLLVASLLFFSSSHALPSPDRSLSPGEVTGADALLKRDASPTDDGTCAANRPCVSGACCSKTGRCGYGPTYCGDGCLSNCKAHAECGQYSESGDATCPQDACCSQYGLCGVTDEFCGAGCQSNCGSLTPSRPNNRGDDVRKNIVGYYQGWKAHTSKCGAMDISQIPAEELGAVNLAYASISPRTLDIEPMDQFKADLFAEIVKLKKRSPSPQVWVSIGGYAFNNNDNLFSKIARSEDATTTFAANLHKFVKKYGFNGVDIDWQYPGAPDRAGHPEDVDNFPRMLERINQYFQNQGTRYGLSVTVPVSHWYYRWFNLRALSSQVDFFNLMSYDLHGTGDSENSSGWGVYAHTNRTEIMGALDHMEREKVPSQKINLGLSLYARSYHLKDPSCKMAGCEFLGPGERGPCTDTAGILSYKEVEDIRRSLSSVPTQMHDEQAGVNILITKTAEWISYDDHVTFQQKIDLANKRGLRGLSIWAIDEDTADFQALKAVTGRKVKPSFKPSSVSNGQSVFDSQKCIITGCNEECPAGLLKMTGLNLDRSLSGCPDSNSNNQRRSLCCPPRGAPDPSTCAWRGSHPECFGQCAAGEVLLAEDNFGNGGWCRNGVKTFCCPGTKGGFDAVAACQWTRETTRSRCPDERPQLMISIGRSVDPFTNIATKDIFCCPAQPNWKNCDWHGDTTSCNGNRCPVGQLGLATSSEFRGGCFLGRQKAFCCDDPSRESGSIPIGLDKLFPYSIGTSDKPVYYEAFDTAAEMTPKNDHGKFDDPNQEPFAWIIMVGGEKDVQSLDKRDGSHLELFDCPRPSKTDLGAQRLRAVCTSHSDDNNCEHVKLGSVEGTIARLPAHCGPDEWVRIVSFDMSENKTIPHHLSKRVPGEATVYDIQYDFDFRNLRRDGGEVYVRIDASDHPGYWDAIVASNVEGKKREVQQDDWREFHLSWFRERGLLNENRGEQKRGYGASEGWWARRFEQLLDEKHNWGIEKRYNWTQVLYSARKTCPGSADAYLEARLDGGFRARLDYGLSIIGTLKDFDFSKSYAYFKLGSMTMDASATLDAYAGIQIQSKKIPLLQGFDPFGGSYNIKGLLELGPYIDVEAQLRADILASGTVSTGLSVTSSSYTWMYPKSLGHVPKDTSLSPFPRLKSMSAGPTTEIEVEGQATVSVLPSFGFKIKLALSQGTKIDTSIKASFNMDTIWLAGAAYAAPLTTLGCNGVIYGLDAGFSAAIDAEGTIPSSWKKDGGNHYEIIPYTRYNLHPVQCHEWNNSSPGRRSELGVGHLSLDPDYSGDDVSSADVKLRKRAPKDREIPDEDANFLSCCNNWSTEGECAGGWADLVSDNLMRRAFAPGFSAADMDLQDIIDELVPLNTSDSISHLQERAKYESKKDNYAYCVGQQRPNLGKLEVEGFWFPSATGLFNEDSTTAASAVKYKAYGPLHSPSDNKNCEDYSFGLISAPGSSDGFNSEHILEWQVLKEFVVASPDLARYTSWNVDRQSGKTDKDKNPARWNYCAYMKYWWGTRDYAADGRDAMSSVMRMFPNRDQHKSELTYLTAKTNLAKQYLFTRSGRATVPRTEQTMKGYIAGEPMKAVAILRETMQAITYLKIDDIKETWITQAKRIGEKFDEIEEDLSKRKKDDLTFKNEQVYAKLHLGDEWRNWVYESHGIAKKKALGFLEEWTEALNVAFRDDSDPDNAAGSQPGSQPGSGNVRRAPGGSKAGGRKADGSPPTKGGKNTNSAMKKTVKKLIEAYEKFKADTWENPFPAEWEFKDDDSKAPPKEDQVAPLPDEGPGPEISQDEDKDTPAPPKEDAPEQPKDDAKEQPKEDSPEGLPEGGPGPEIPSDEGGMSEPPKEESKEQPKEDSPESRRV